METNAARGAWTIQKKGFWFCCCCFTAAKMESSGGTREQGRKLPSLISSVMRNGNPLNQCPPGLVLPLSCEFGLGFCKNLLSEVLRCVLLCAGVGMWVCGCPHSSSAVGGLSPQQR